MIESFFKHLSERRNSENDLSDITWALAKADPKFMKTFMAQFKFDFKIDEPWDMYREVSEDHSRPDFKIEQGDKLFVVENKINDQNDHFEQYSNTFSKAKVRCGFIANYSVPTDIEKFEFICITWEDFVKALSREIEEDKDVAEDESSRMRRAYIGYVKEVCGIMDMTDMRFRDAVSLVHFDKVITNTIQSQAPGFDCQLYKKDNSVGCSGRYFTLKRKEGKEIYPWFGIWYAKTPPTIYISFRKDWCEKVHDNFKKFDKKRGRYFDPPEINKDSSGDELNFELNEKVLEEFLGAPLDRQKEILKNFFDEVIGEVGTVL